MVRMMIVRMVRITMWMITRQKTMWRKVITMIIKQSEIMP